jgi:hypothetical protein
MRPKTLNSNKLSNCDATSYFPDLKPQLLNPCLHIYRPLLSFRASRRASANALYPTPTGQKNTASTWEFRDTGLGFKV